MLNKPTKVLEVKSKKRDDIQCLRALAVIVVVAFHIFPEWFPQGFLGVDIFFVISGYLITSILDFSISKSITFKICCDFYVRRIKRILPAYYLVIFITFLICSFFLVVDDFKNLKQDIIWSSLFVSNIKMLFNLENYFQEVGSFNFLLHTWSLSVEIQFYLIAPLLLYLINISKWSKFFTFTCILSSWIFQTFNPNPTVAFAIVFSRIWQFLIGTIVFYEEKTISNSSSKFMKYLKNFYYFPAIFALVCVLVIPELSQHWFYPVFMRTLATVLSGFLILFGTIQEMVNIPILKSFLSFIGDASYSIYLVHWPIITLAKYLVMFEENVILITVVVFAVGILQYELFETKISKWSTKNILIFIKVVLIGIFSCFFLQGQKLPSNYVEKNYELVKECKNHIDILRQCKMNPSFEFPKKDMPIDSYLCSFDGNGTGTYMIAGNSFAMRQIFELMKELKGNYKKMYIASQSMCTTFLDINLFGWRCNYVASRLLQIMELLKPDVTIVSQRLDIFEHPILKSRNDAKNDNFTKIYEKYWLEYSKFTKQIIIVEPYATLYGTDKESLIKLLRQNESLTDYFVPKDEMEKQVDSEWWRTLESVVNCPICSTVEIRHRFCRGKKCDIYDPSNNHMLYCDAGHLNSEGLARITPDIIKAITKI